MNFELLLIFNFRVYVASFNTNLLIQLGTLELAQGSVYQKLLGVGWSNLDELHVDLFKSIKHSFNGLLWISIFISWPPCILLFVSS